MFEEDPLVSVIVPAYNAGWCLARTLASISGQTYQTLEIILVDDGSTDDTLRIAEAHAVREPRLRIVRQTNKGLAAARNRGIREACGVYVAPIDGDDLWHMENVESQIAALERGSPCSPFSFAYSYWIDQVDRVFPFKVPDSPPGMDFCSLLRRNTIGNGSAAIFRRGALIAAGGYDETLRERGAEGAEDWKLCLRLTSFAPPIVVPHFLIAYRITEGSMSANPMQQTRAVMAVLSDVRKEMPRVAPYHYWAGRTAALVWLLPRWTQSRKWVGALRYMFISYGTNPFWFLDPAARDYLKQVCAALVRKMLHLPKPTPPKVGHINEVFQSANRPVGHEQHCAHS
jgi:glycosyltransferase involved in cell wall biosynthesis